MIPQEALADAVELDFAEEEEHWNIYKLSDGTRLKVRLVLRGVKRLSQYEPDGNPVYVINTLNVVRAVDVPPEVKKQSKKSPMPPV